VSASLHLAGPDDLGKLEPLVAAFHTHIGHKSDEAARQDMLMPVLEGSPLAVAYLIGIRRAPVGYIGLSFGYSFTMGGITASVEEFFIREKLRRRGMGGEVLGSLASALSGHGVVAMRVSALPWLRPCEKLFYRALFRADDGAPELIRRL
jgi:hypothetical protein